MYAPNLFATACDLAGTFTQCLAWCLTRKQYDTVVTGDVYMGLVFDFPVLAKCILDA